MEILSNSTKKMARSAMPNILQLFVLFIIIIVFKPSLQYVIIIFLSANLIVWLFGAARSWPVKKKIKDLFIGSVTIYIVVTAIYWLNYLFGSWGFWGLLIVAVAIVVYKMFRRWDEFIAVKHEGERALFGETIKERHDRKIKGGKK